MSKDAICGSGTRAGPRSCVQLAAFSGTWEGRWIGPGGAAAGALPSRLIVEKITAKSAQVVYLYGTQPGYFSAGWFRAHASVLPFGQIQFGGGGRALLTFTMSQDQKSVAGTFQARGGSTSTITMTRVR